MASETETPKRKWSVGRIVLILSLALNLLVVGLVAGALLHRHQLPDRPPRIADLGFGPYVRSLSREDREALGTAFKAEEGNFRERRETLRRQFEELLTALRATPYNHDAVQAIITSQQEEALASQRVGSRLFLDHLAGMSDAQRAAYADKLESDVKRWRRDGPDKRDDD
ncbi:periplasmic heavy metal sensor [Psychromarinibacter halotolerans]|uniref:Periplasmic heavy metal sensor n=1 Tax=Psychromarinibacter halotolerans TaxID=1775175 RepID=A0ABV7GNS3_9RHOB|nr:periplasmic heavy metal sensor [Psychromarinibacter halotolerans]MDF0597028.1 periplasmic heavy metal sensor [Psychromarinibacter halotolerans]